MPERPRPTRPGFWSQALAILKLSAQSARNKFGAAKASKPGMRSATAYKHDKKPLLPVLFALLMFGVVANSAYQGIHGMASYADSHWPKGSEGIDVIEVGAIEYHGLEDRAERLDAFGSREESRDRFAKSLMTHNELEEEAAQARAEELLSHLEETGMQGFVRTGGAPDLYKFVDFRGLSSQAAAWLSRVLAFVLGCLVIALVLTPLSARNKDLGALDAQLEWFYCLPLTGREILSGRFTSAALVKPLAWIILLPMFSVNFWAMGHGPTSVLYALIATLAVAVATAGIELIIETWMRTSGSFRLKKNVQSLATIMGTLTLILGMAAGIAAIRSVGWINWLLDHTPEWLTAAPGKLLMMPTSGTAGIFSFLGIIVVGSTLCGGFGWLLAARTMRRGLSSGSERSGNRLGRATASTRSFSLAKFEWLLLARDRNLAATVLVVPLIMVFYQLLVNPEMLAVVSAQKLAVLGFGCGVWAATTTAPHVLLSESNSLWMIFGLPVSISDHFQRRTRAWRLSGTFMAGGVILGLALWKGFPAENWWRVPAALVGVWVISLVVYAIMMGDAKLPDAASGERVKISVTRIYGCMLVGGAVGAVIWYGTAWHILVTLVLWWFFGFGMWQGVTRKLQYLLEPTEHAKRQLTLASAMFAIIVFFAAQAIASAILVPMVPDDLPGAVLLSYIVGGLAGLVFCGLRLSGHQLPRRAATENRLFATLSVCAAACIACGWGWLMLLDHFPPLKSLYDSAKASSAGRLDPKDLQIVLLAVVAAPILEELVFRSFVLRIMQSVWSTRGSILANALLFAIVHPAFSFPPVFLLGAAAAFLYTRTQKVWPSILLHAAYNAAVVAMQ